MNLETVRRLNAINREFYRRRAREFHAARAAPWPGWERLPPLLRRCGAADRLAVLDVGCGNGRFAAFLAERWGTPFRHVGIDASPPLLARARERRLPGVTSDWRIADFVAFSPREVLPEESFSLVALFGVLHHVPGATRRAELLRAAGARLAPGGLLVVTSWQFEAFRRFRARLVPWEAYNREAREPVDIDELEAGDHLLAWGEEGNAVRYCHFSDEAETANLVGALGLESLARFRADGREGGLNRYFVVRAPGPPAPPDGRD